MSAQVTVGTPDGSAGPPGSARPAGVANGGVPGPSARLRRRRRTQKVVLTVVAALLSTVFVIPLVWLAAAAFRPASESFQAGVDIWTFLPRTFTFDNFTTAFERGFGRNLVNSLVVTSVSVVVGLAIAVLAAFAFAVLRFRGRELLFTLVVLAFMIPFEIVAVPLARVFSSMSVENNLLALILPGVVHGLAIFNLRQFFLGVPRELLEAAMLDGASWWRVLARIYVPQVKPALIGSGMILALAQWNAYVWPSLIINENQNQTAAVAIGLSDTPYTRDFGIGFAAVALLALVPAVLIAILQRKLTSSVALTSRRTARSPILRSSDAPR